MFQPPARFSTLLCTAFIHLEVDTQDHCMCMVGRGQLPGTCTLCGSHGFPCRSVRLHDSHFRLLSPLFLLKVDPPRAASGHTTTAPHLSLLLPQVLVHYPTTAAGVASDCGVAQSKSQLSGLLHCCFDCLDLQLMWEGPVHRG